MKKILSLIAATSLSLGLISCSGDLHDVELIDLSGYGIRGTGKESGWDAASDIALTANDDGTFTGIFTATGTSSHGGDDFAIVECGDATWATAYRLKQPKSKGDTANTFNDTDGWEQKVYLGQSAYCCNIPSTTAGDIVKLTITPATTYLTVKVEVTSGSGTVVVYPTPYYLHGFFVSGDMNNWTATNETVLADPSLEEETGIVTYTYDFKASNTSDSFGIRNNTGDWKIKYTGASFDLSKDTDYKATEKNADSNNTISNLTSNKFYRLYIKTTPEEEVLFKVVTLNELTVTLNISGLPNDANGKTMYLTGDYNGWKTPEAGKENDGVYPVTITSGGGTITFTEIYEGSSYEKDYQGKIASAGWTKPEICADGGANASFTITETKSTVKVEYVETNTISGNAKESENGAQYYCDWTVE